MERQDHPPTATETAYSQSVAITQAEQAAVAAMNRDAAFARHTAQALDLLEDAHDVPRLDDRRQPR